MQATTAAPRDALTDAQVRDQLGQPLLTKVGLERLGPDLTVLEDISGRLGAGSVKHANAATVHGILTCSLDTELAWGSALIRPYIEARSTMRSLMGPVTTTARYYQGTYSPSTPSTSVSGQRQPFAVTGYDRLFLLDRFLPDTYTIAAGTDYLTAITAAVAASGIPAATVLLDRTAAGKTLPAAKTWPLLPTGADRQDTGHTWLSLINELLSAVGYRGLWCDELGYFRSGPYLAPGSRPVEWDFTTTKPADVVALNRRVLLGHDRTLTRDDWALPNRWTFYQRNPAAGSAALTYTRDDLAGQARRGLVWPAQPVALDAADATALRVQGDALADNDLRVSAKLETTTSPFPLAGHADIYSLTDTRLGVTSRVAADSWTQTWDQAGLIGDTQHEWRLIA